MPPKGKAKNAPNQHDKRHENGLAPPGKRVVKQRSGTQLNGAPNGKPISPPALPSTGLNQGFKFPRPADHPPSSATSTIPASVAPAITVAAARDHVAAPSGQERARTTSDASGDDTGTYDDDNYHDTITTSHRAAHDPALMLMANNAPPTSTFKAQSVSKPGSFSTVSTILAYYPLRDAIAILILLLSLPPTLVLVIQTLFASLTFVPPTAGLTLSTLPTIKDMLNLSNFGFSAMAAVLCLDIIYWACWLVMWVPMQNAFLDLSQAVIAVSLSGAAAGPGGPMYSTATCALIVCVVHVLRYQAIHLTALDYLRSVLHKLDIGFDFDVSSFAIVSSHSIPPPDRGSAYMIFRTFLGIHILSQGTATCISRAIVLSNERGQNPLTSNKTDTEAVAGAESASRANSGLADTVPSPHASASTDGRPPGPSSSHRDNRLRESSKKKRKQANEVRSQQPLWAAIASTKVTFVKEMEQRDAADDAREAESMDKKTDTNTNPSSASCSTDRIWICEVRDTEICFCVELSQESAAARTDSAEGGSHLRAGIDQTKPFYVRINGAAWSSTRIMPDSPGEDANKQARNRYSGEIFGLAPLGSYHCEILSMASQKVLCSAGLVTQPSPTAEQTASAPVQPQHQTLRPSSPITTLKQSIQSAEAKLNEVRNRTKKTKRDQRAAFAEVRKEINTLKSKLESWEGTDDKMERRLLQLTQHRDQAEKETAELKEQIEALGEIPNEELVAHQTARQRWQTAMDAKNAASRAFDEAKAESERDLSGLKLEISASEAKKEKLMARNAQRTQELEKLIAKQQADLTAKQRRETERAAELRERERREAEIRFHINTISTDANALAQKAQEAWQQASALSNNWNTQPPSSYTAQSVPSTPEGILPGTNVPLHSPPNGFAVPAFAPQPTFNPAFRPTPAPANPHVANPTAAPRGRSSSMLSQYSGFTDNGEDVSYGQPEPRHQNSWPMQGSHHASGDFAERKGSDGDGSASGSGGVSQSNGSTDGSSSPRPEARPFVPSVGTIGPPSQMSQSPVPSHVGTAGHGR